MITNNAFAVLYEDFTLKSGRGHGFLGQTAAMLHLVKLDRDPLADALLLHRHAIQNVRDLHGSSGFVEPASWRPRRAPARRSGDCCNDPGTRAQGIAFDEGNSASRRP